MKNALPILILIGSIIQIYFLGNAAFKFAHFHIDWVCESGNKLINDNSNIEEARRFEDLCKETEQHYKQIAMSTFKAVVYNGIILISFIILAIVQIIIYVYNKKKQNK